MLWTILIYFTSKAEIQQCTTQILVPIEIHIDNMFGLHIELVITTVEIKAGIITFLVAF